MSDITDFEDIRPYNDSEVRSVLDRLSADPEFLDLLASFRFPKLVRKAPWLLRPFVRRFAKKVFAGLDSVDDLQKAIRAGMRKLLADTNTEVTFSGLDALDKGKSYLLLSNHRDITMDSALVNLILAEQGWDTIRSAAGDNLLTKAIAADLLRLNKSFVVKRSVSGRREKLAALQKLSSYIRYSVTQESCSVWIAQREGRAKDGIDKTEPALLKMLALSKQKEQSFAEAIRELNVVPVAISYEFDPLDKAKGRELYAVQQQGCYEKSENEDAISIYRGIVGSKGAVHIAFGKLMTADIDTPEQMAEAVDRQIIGNYYLHTSNIVAYEKLYGASEKVVQWRPEKDWQQSEQAFLERMEAIPDDYRDIVLAMYANPVCQKLQLS